MKILCTLISVVVACMSLVACALPGWGFSYASDFVQTQRVNLKVMNVEFDGTQNSGNITLGIRGLSVKERFYLSEKFELGWRYFTVFRKSEDCRYSIFVDQQGVVKSWRDEGGKTHMNKCYVG
jgi:hypothetical protein